MSENLISPWNTQANPEAIARVGIAGTLQSQPDGTSSVTGNIEIVAATTDGTRIGSDDVQILVPTLRIEVVQNDFPNAAAHVRQAEAVTAFFSVMIDG